MRLCATAPLLTHPVSMVGHMAMLTVLLTNWLRITDMHARLLPCRWSPLHAVLIAQRSTHLLKPHRGGLCPVDHRTICMLPVDVWEGVAAKGVWLALATDTCSPDPVSLP